MIFLSVNHNLLYTILGTYPPGPFRNNQNSPKKFFIFPAFPATLFQRGNFQHAKFFQRGKFAGKAIYITDTYINLHVILPLSFLKIWTVS